MGHRLLSLGLSRAVGASLLVLALAACAGGAASEPTAGVPAGAATAAPAGTTRWEQLPQGRTPEGYQVLGRADAPVTITFYSDFF